MPQEQVHAKVSQPGPDAAQRTTYSDDVDRAVADAVDRAVADETLDATDDLLDEIDSLLEVNAEEFVRNYVQKGGQ